MTSAARYGFRSDGRVEYYITFVPHSPRFIFYIQKGNGCDIEIHVSQQMRSSSLKLCRPLRQLTSCYISPLSMVFRDHLIAGRGA